MDGIDPATGEYVPAPSKVRGLARPKPLDRQRQRHRRPDALAADGAGDPYVQPAKLPRLPGITPEWPPDPHGESESEDR